MTSGNPILLALDAAKVPWQSSRAALAERFGVRAHPAYGWEVIEVDTSETHAPIVTGLLWPLSAQVLPRFSPGLPATSYSGSVWFGDDARENLQRSEEQLAARLGPGEVTGSSNTLGKLWKHGPASLSLMVWPSEMQKFPLHIPAHEREPRLVAACHLEIETGFRLAFSSEERRALASFERIAPLPNFAGTLASLHDTPARQSELEFVREPIAEIERNLGWIGHSRDHQWLMFFGQQVYLVPLRKVIGFHVERTLPAKGPGGSRLLVECRTDYAACPSKRLAICSGTGAEDLNELAADVSARTERPLALGPHEYDA